MLISQTPRFSSLAWTPLRSVAIVAGLTVLLMAPAFWNAFPLLYYDSLDYITMSAIWRMPVYRTGAYGVFALPARLTGSLWAVIALQSAICAYVLLEAARRLVPGLGPARIAAMVLVLLVATSLPWGTSTFMPDALTGVAILATLLLALCHDDLGPVRRWVMVAILAIGSASHPTHLALLAGLVICMAVMDFLARRSWPFCPMTVRLVIVGLVIGTLLSAASNWLMTKRYFLAPQTTAILTLAVLVQDGLANRYLEEACVEPGPGRKPILCPYRHDMPNNANAFLWHNQDFWDLNGWYGFMDEAPWMVGEIIRRYPLDFAWTVAKLMAEQLVTLKTGEGLEPMQKFIGEAIRIFYPWLQQDFLDAYQQTIPDASFLPLEGVNLLHVPVGLLSVVLLGVAAWLAARRRDSTGLTLAGLALLVYVGNAFICGAISNPADRYGARIAWVMTMIALMVVPPGLKDRRR